VATSKANWNFVWVKRGKSRIKSLRTTMQAIERETFAKHGCVAIKPALDRGMRIRESFA